MCLLVNDILPELLCLDACLDTLRIACKPDKRAILRHQERSNELAVASRLRMKVLPPLADETFREMLPKLRALAEPEVQRRTLDKLLVRFLRATNAGDAPYIKRWNPVNLEEGAPSPIYATIFRVTTDISYSPVVRQGRDQCVILRMG